MKASCRLASAVALLLPLPLSGCFFLSTTRKLPVPKAPLITRTVSPAQLVGQVNRRWADLHSLNLTVDIQASVAKSSQGVAKDYTTFRGIILMRKPEMLRVYGRVPVIGSRMFDMVGDGKTFTLWIPSRNKAVKGPYELKKKSASQVENMRPGFFFDAIAVRGLEPDDLYSIVADTETVEDAAKKHLFTVPEYILSVIPFHRDDLLPYQQDLYDNEGNLETQVFYGQYADYGSGKFPSKITIKRPLEEYQVILNVDKVIANMTLTDDQFEVKIPEDTIIQNLE